MVISRWKCFLIRCSMVSGQSAWPGVAALCPWCAWACWRTGGTQSGPPACPNGFRKLIGEYHGFRLRLRAMCNRFSVTSIGLAVQAVFRTRPPLRTGMLGGVTLAGIVRMEGMGHRERRRNSRGPYRKTTQILYSRAAYIYAAEIRAISIDGPLFCRVAADFFVVKEGDRDSVVCAGAVQSPMRQRHKPRSDWPDEEEINSFIPAQETRRLHCRNE